MHRQVCRLMAGAAVIALSAPAAYSQELTIFWAEWDPANYLQELVNEYEAETGVTVTVETRPGRISRPRLSPNSTPADPPMT